MSERDGGGAGGHGAYLKDRRSKLDPAALGFGVARRRTPGLRREEVTQRANIRPTWYTWLEQVRGGAPSAEVLDRIARALMLTEVEREHLFLLGLGRPPEARFHKSESVTPRLQRVLNARGMAMLLFDLLTAEEEADRENVFDIALLSERLAAVLHWARDEEELAGLPVGLFGASTGAAAGLMVAARPDAGIFAVISRGGRPDLAGERLSRIAVPVLLIVGDSDPAVLKLNEDAFVFLKGPKRLKVIPGVFEEPGALEDLAAGAIRWFEDYSPVRTVGSI